MTIANSTNKSGPYFYNGAATSFAYGFKIDDEAHIRVVETTLATGVEVDLTLNSDYTVTGVGNDTGNVVISPARAEGKSVVLVRNVPFTQELDLQNQGAYFAESVEAAFDRSVARDQQLAEQISRAVVVPVSTDGTDIEALIGGVVALLDNVDAVVTVAANITEILAVDTLAGQVAADRVQTGLDRIATAADRVQTGLDRVATAADRVATAADRVQTGLDRVAAAASAASVNAANLVTISPKTLTQAEKNQFALNIGMGYVQIGDRLALTGSAGAFWTDLDYDELFLSINGNVLTDGGQLSVEFSEDNGSTLLSNYAMRTALLTVGTSVTSASAVTEGLAYIDAQARASFIRATVSLERMNKAANVKMISSEAEYIDNATASEAYMKRTGYRVGGVVNAVKFGVSGSLFTGTVTLWGRK